MATVGLTLEEIEELTREVLLFNGCDDLNTDALVRTIVTAERDGSASHGLFRLPGYVASLKSGKVNGKARPTIDNKLQAIVKVHGDNGYAPISIEIGVPVLAAAAKSMGVAAMAMTNIYHFAALWPEVEALAEDSLIGMACVCTYPFVAPAGGAEALFGTNPIAFAWPRPGKTSVVIDMATATMALGEIQVAAREGEVVALGTGLDAQGQETTDPNKILDGVLLPFGGYKGSAVALMVELLAAGAIGDCFSFEGQAMDNGDGGPTIGGEFMLAISPEILGGSDWAEHSELFFDRFEAIQGARLPGQRRHINRLSTAPRQINAKLVDRIEALRA